MKKLASHDIREIFLKFFVEKNHNRISGASVIPHNDPSLLFINSGMAPLKKYFLGLAQPDIPRLTNVQPCIRTIDIDDVGDRHHLTMFEMLGSWSIGDYYKTKAISLAYELLVDRFGFDPDRLIVTVYEGNKALNLPPDEESIRAWEKVGMKSSQIIALGDDNFWGPAGETGPCGPCTEVFFDCGEEYGPAYVPGQEFDTTKRYIEIWNAGVFMELNKKADGSFSPLPLKSVDTGSGVERMTMVMNELQSVYETDLMLPLMNLTAQQKAAGKLTVVEQRILADHSRASTYLLSEGVIPSNEGRGYIPRRLIRKSIALLHKAGESGNQLLPMTEAVIESLGEFYPLLKRNEKLLINNLKAEIEEFEPILSQGVKLMDQKISALKGKSFGGAETFELVATHGIPLEIIKSYTGQRGIGVDESSYQDEFRKHQEISRRGIGSKDLKVDQSGDLSKKILDFPQTKFTGYTETESTGKIIGLFDSRKNSVDSLSDTGYLIVDNTPFYGESGGQVGDTGQIFLSDSKKLIATISDTQKEEKRVVHQVSPSEGISLEVGQQINLRVDNARRLTIRRNHSTAHLLQSALRQTLGETVVQKGSHVDAERLRFDFQHNKPLTSTEIQQVEKLVNSWIWANATSITKEQDYQAALAEGALAMLGENYSDKVRTIQLGPTSYELCGGTHVERTGEIGMFLILQQSSVAKGIRRIEGVTGSRALELTQERINVVKSLSEQLSAKPEALEETIQKLKKQASSKAKAAKQQQKSNIQWDKKEIINLKNGLKAFLGMTSEDGADLKSGAEDLLGKEFGSVCLISVSKGNAKVSAMSSKQCQDDYPAKEILTPVIAALGGRGGGKSNFAQGGGKNLEGIDQAWTAAKDGYQG